MKQRLLAIWLFYQSFYIFTGAISVGSWALVSFPVDQDFIRFLPLYVLVKIFSDALVWYYSGKYNPDRLFFYSNLGISKTRLFLSAFALDLMLFFCLVIVAYSIINVYEPGS